VARNFFLSSEQTLKRKAYEALLAWKIEKNLTKDQILEVYMNQIYLGQRAFGFSSAAQIYFGKDLRDISVAEAAMLAGLPKAPSAYNPVVNPKRAARASSTSCSACTTLGYITDAQYAQAKDEELKIKTDSTAFGVHAEYVAEMARQLVYEQFKEDTYTRGLNVFTTITKADQDAAYLALRRGVMDYERRHGYRGPEAYIEIPDEDKTEPTKPSRPSWPSIRTATTSSPPWCCRPADPGDGGAGLGEEIKITGAGLAFAARAGCPTRRPEPAHPPRRGDPRDAGRRLELEHHPDAGSRIGLRRGQHRRRRDPRAGRRLRLQPQQVQPRDAGLAPAGFLVQALHLFGLAGTRLVAGHPDQRRADLLRRRPDRRPGLGAEELRRQVRRPDDDAARPDQVEEHDLDPHPEQDRRPLRPGIRDPLRLRRRQEPALPDAGAGRRRDHAAADGRRLRVFANGGYRVSPT
jgi:hypothetical protein